MTLNSIPDFLIAGVISIIGMGFLWIICKWTADKCADYANRKRNNKIYHYYLDLLHNFVDVESLLNDKMPNVIELDLPNCIVLGGLKKGRALYKKQLKKRLTTEILEQGVTIKFPDSVIYIGSFFIDGLLAPIIKSIGREGLLKKVRFETASEKLTKEIYSHSHQHSPYPYN
ncbi:hypothetical protein G6R29_05060 [Fructobacillus sp. M2-14]|uniref:Uncharacterized protein n=1 Tax=Fructobacillus broussonetiae TaxID=2713173 RepID=A0ABS5R0L0_9LACO|nr:hypothetical protein [Fructobacillus broussonetiae]MBS9338988.1 hypothetical protein [Fructobacillus broussonetiae]